MTVDLSWLATYRSSEPHFDLERMGALLALRGNPHLACPVIHLAGTNGKGSTLAHLRSLLEAKGLRVGVFSSPYLVSFHEQISINGLPISDQDLETYLSLDQDLLAKNSSDQTLLGLTEFELMTVLAFDYFAAEKPDVVILEVGMGGRLDSTNVCQPILTAITTIGLDHVALLGPDLASIAREKAGIIKEKIPVLLGRMDLEAQEVSVQGAYCLSEPVSGRNATKNRALGTSSSRQCWAGLGSLRYLLSRKGALFLKSRRNPPSLGRGPVAGTPRGYFDPAPHHSRWRP